MKVAAILDAFSLAITKRDGPHLGIGDILCIGEGAEVIDPETGEVLGRLDMLRVKVTDVYEKFVVAETYRMDGKEPVVTVNIGDQAWAWPGRNSR